MRRFWFSLIVCATASPAWAQSEASAKPRGTALDTVVAVQDFLFEDSNWRAQVIVDSSMSAELAPGLQANVRPVVWKVNGRWESLLDQASVRYDVAAGANIRVEAGRFPSPIGLGMTENRANLNAGVLWCHRPYYMALPTTGPAPARLSLVSAVYPTGVSASATSRTNRWDARVAVVDRAPIDFWSAPAARRPRANTLVGAGFSPTQGARVGMGVGRGTLAADAGVEDGRYELLNVEADWAFGYSRVSGEWTRSRVEARGVSRAASGVTVQWRQTLSPRWFAHNRTSLISGSLDVSVDTPPARRFSSVDSTIGYLVSPDVTVRVGHSAVRSWTRPSTDHQLGLSLVFARRWW
jgi:hypothetical protein